MSKGSGIKLNPANKGKLHKTLHVPKGEKIPVAKIEKAKASPNPVTRKRANFALNAKKWAK